MTEPAALPWDRLTPSARDTVVELICLLADHFTGKITLDCNEGGVTNIDELRRRRPGDIARGKR